MLDPECAPEFDGMHMKLARPNYGFGKETALGKHGFVLGHVLIPKRFEDSNSLLDRSQAASECAPTNTSTIGFAATPGMAVLPMCSMRKLGTGNTLSSSRRSASRRCAHCGECGAS